MRMPSPKRLPVKLKTLAWASGIGAVAVLLIVTAPDTHSRLVTAFELGIVGIVLAVAVRRMLRRIDRTMLQLAEALDDLQDDPRTTVAAQRAMDGIRNIWGDQADRWLNKSGLN